MRQPEAGAPKLTTPLEISLQNGHRFGVPGGLAGDLAQNQAASGQGGEDERRTNLGAGKVGERERHDDHIAAYKSRDGSD